MKKSFKVFCAVLIFAVLSCPLFAGCADSDAKYVDGSLNYEIDVYTYTVYVRGSFEADFYSDGEYTVEYNMELYYKQQLVATKSCKNTKTVADSGTKSVSVYESIDVTWTGGNLSRDYDVKISNVRITKEKTYDNSQGYAIGFGVTAAILTCGITAFFVLTKRSGNK